ncbi:MAG: HIT domain-containing protein [Planctomycetota bacterium]
MNNRNLWAPWRRAYLEDLLHQASLNDDAPAESASFLSTYWAQPEHDEAHHVIHRNDVGMIMLNRYPYANGHLLVALGDARPTLLDYDADQRAAMWSLVDLATALVTIALSPQGVNVGINQGHAAGAGVPSHLHAHVVPRWEADTNFITVVGRVRVVPDALESMASTMRSALPTALARVKGV